MHKVNKYCSSHDCNYTVLVLVLVLALVLVLSLVIANLFFMLLLVVLLEPDGCFSFSRTLGPPPFFRLVPLVCTFLRSESLQMLLLSAKLSPLCCASLHLLSLSTVASSPCSACLLYSPFVLQCLDLVVKYSWILCRLVTMVMPGTVKADSSSWC